MSWTSARASAALLAERLKRLDVARTGGAGDRRMKPRDETTSPAQRASPPEPFFVKPSRTIEPTPPPAAETFDDQFSDLLEEAAAAPVKAPSAPAEPSEHRRAPRKHQVLPAYVTSPEMAALIPARVIDMSATGAKIELTPMGRSTGIPMTHLPNRYTLVLRHDRMEVDCETVWREEWYVGVRFLGFPRPMQAGRK
ncbi:MAG: PilZ domain-containing protein [Hyphomicrobiaceae bacterium]